MNITSINITLDWIISGARYSGVPHKVHVLSVIFFAKPKSVICESLCLILRKGQMFGFPHLQVAFLVQQQVLRLHVPITTFLVIFYFYFALSLSLPPVDDGEGVKILKGGHNLSGVEEGGGVRELPRAEQHHEGLTSKWQREQGCDV